MSNLKISEYFQKIFPSMKDAENDLARRKTPD